MNLPNFQLFAAPTETLPGLFCKYEDFDSIEKIYKIKSRTKLKKLMLLANSFDQTLSLFDLNASQLDFINRNKSSEISFLCPVKSEIILNENLYSLENGLRYSGLRVTNEPSLIEIINQVGILAQTSLNVSGEDPILDSRLIPSEISNQLDFVIDFKYEILPQASTLVKLYSDKIEVLRQGKYLIK